MPANSIFPVLQQNLFSMLRVMMKVLSHASARNKMERTEGLKFGTFTGHFQVTSWQ